MTNMKRTTIKHDNPEKETSKKEQPGTCQLWREKLNNDNSEKEPSETRQLDKGKTERGQFWKPTFDECQFWTEKKWTMTNLKR